MRIGTRDMPREVLLKYADYFNVTIDFLLGRTDDPEMKPAAVDELGLSPQAIALLKKYSPITHYGERTVLDYLLTHKEFEKIVEAVACIMYYDYRAKTGAFSLSKKDGVFLLQYWKGRCQKNSEDP